MEQPGQANDEGISNVKEGELKSVTNGSVRVKNRRRIYLDKHPSYFTQPELELAGIRPHTPQYMYQNIANWAS